MRYLFILGVSLVGCTANTTGDGHQDAAACAADNECTGATPRCDVSSGRCVPCLPEADNCPSGMHCIDTNGNFGCSPSCRNAADCPKSDAGVPGQCCNGVCLDTSIDVKNCGGCGKVCAEVANGVPACIGATCRPTCSTGFGDCDGDLANGCESDTRSDQKNCGACGKPCDPVANGTNSCVMGACVVTCRDGFADCDGNPSNGCEVNKNINPANCGGCGTNCGAAPHATSACVNGGCVIAGCDSGFADCDNKPYNGCEIALGTDPANCGGCAKACPNYPNGVAACVNGGCQLSGCNMGFANCDNVSDNGCEINLMADAANCGSCRKACITPHAMPACMAGICAIGGCTQGFADCDMMVPNGCEVQVSSDTANCGTCGTVCPTPANAAPACTNGLCGGTCKFGWGDCDMSWQNGCETNLVSELNNCGKCGNVCPALPNATPGCAAGLCGIAMCNALFGNCDGNAQNGCETSLAADIKNCGACGKTCTAANGTPGCINGQCGILACNAGYADCDGNAANGCEVNSAYDASNCGKCGNVCPMNTPVCANGACVVLNTKVLIVYAEGLTWAQDVQAKLLGTGAFAAVDLFDAISGTPTLAQLTPYGAILVFSDSGFSNNVALGDVVADYFDGGGQVVIATFANASVPIRGRFGTVGNGYMLINPTGQEEPTDSLGTINEPLSPLMAGVTQLSAMSAYRSIGGAVNGGIVVAQWRGGRPLVVRGVVKGRNRADLNFFPPSSTVRADLWVGDGAKLMRNALLYR